MPDLRARDPWAEPPGWEFDALRALPRDEARAVWDRAVGTAWEPFLRTPSGRRMFTRMMVLVVVVLNAVWIVCGAFGWGFWAKIAGEFGAHVLLARTYERAYRALRLTYLVPFLREYLHEELLLHVQTFSAERASALWDALAVSSTVPRNCVPAPQ